MLPTKQALLIARRAASRSPASPPSGESASTYLAAIHACQIVDDGQPEPAAGHLLIGPDAAAQHGLALLGGDALAVVVDRGSRAGPVRCGPRSRRGAPPTCRRCRAGCRAFPADPALRRETPGSPAIGCTASSRFALGMDAPHGPHQPIDDRRERRAGAGQADRGGRLRPCQVVVDLLARRARPGRPPGGPARSSLPAAGALARTLNGVFSAWARLPAWVRARSTTSAFCASTLLNSSTSGMISAGKSPSSRCVSPPRTAPERGAQLAQRRQPDEHLHQRRQRQPEAQHAQRQPERRR